jgi:hypothetical protein
LRCQHIRVRYAQACGRRGFAFAVTPDIFGHFRRLSSGMAHAPEQEPQMSQALETAHLRAWNLATTLMVCVIVFKAGDGFGFMPTSEYDGDVEIVHDYDPWKIMCSPE